MTAARLMTLRDAAAYLAVGKWTLTDMANRGEIMPVQRRKGCAMLFDRADLDKWIDAHKKSRGDG